VIGLDPQTVGCWPHGHHRVIAQQLRQHAVMSRVEMLDQDEGHAVTGRQRTQQLPAGIEPTSRSTYAND
jgi:hypothetical protein